MNNSYHCIECGKKTLKNTGVDDYEAGEKFICESCGCSVWMSSSSHRVFTVPDPVGYVRPPFIFCDCVDYGDISKRSIVFLLAEMEKNAEELAIFGKVSNKIEAKSETVTFRRPQLFKAVDEQD